MIKKKIFWSSIFLKPIQIRVIFCLDNFQLITIYKFFYNQFFLESKLTDQKIKRF